MTISPSLRGPGNTGSRFERGQLPWEKVQVEWMRLQGGWDGSAWWVKRLSLQVTSPYDHADGRGGVWTRSHCDDITQLSSNNRARSICANASSQSESEITCKSKISQSADPLNSHSMTNCPSSPKTCPNSGSTSNHSFVHSFDPSDQRPVHSALPHGFLTTTKRFPFTSTARRTE